MNPPMAPSDLGLLPPETTTDIALAPGDLHLVGDVGGMASDEIVVVVDVQLTPAGVELVDAVLADLTGHDQLLLDAAMEPHERELLRSLLRKLLTSLEPDEAS
jgi:hypothetical protein